MTEKQTDTRDVVLEIVGTQRLNGDSDKIELTTVGTLQTEPETLVFRYTEQQEPPESLFMCRCACAGIKRRRRFCVPTPMALV